MIKRTNHKKLGGFNNPKTTTSSSQPTLFQLSGVLNLKEFEQAKSVILNYSDLKQSLPAENNDSDIIDLTDSIEKLQTKQRRKKITKALEYLNEKQPSSQTLKESKPLVETLKAWYILSKKPNNSKEFQEILTLAADVYLKYKNHYKKVESRIEEPKKLRADTLSKLTKKLPYLKLKTVKMMEEWLFQNSSTKSLTSSKKGDSTRDNVMQIPRYKNLVNKLLTKLMFKSQCRKDLKKCTRQEEVDDILRTLK